MGADGGIGGTYGVMPELILKIFELMDLGDFDTARKMQFDVDHVIYTMCQAKGNRYAVIKEILRQKDKLDIGGVREPLSNLWPEDLPLVENCVALINNAMEKWILK